MKIKSLYISAQTRGAGSLFISMGMMELLKRNLHRVAFFRPVIYSKDIRNGDIDFILKKYNLDIDYEDCYGFDIDYVEDMIANAKIDELINKLIQKFKKLENNYDFVLIEGIRRSFISSSIDFDLNIEIAKNFGSPLLNIISAKDKTIQDIYDTVLIDNKNLEKKGSTRFATFINRVEQTIYDKLKEKLKSYQNTYLLQEIAELDMLSIGDVITSIKAKPLTLLESDKARIVRCVKVAALSLDNFLEHIQEDDLIVVPADRSDIILGLLGALYSKNYPNISGIVFPFGMHTHPNIKKLIDGLEGFSIPLLSVEDDTYTTAKKLSKAHARLSVDSHRKYGDFAYYSNKYFYLQDGKYMV
ncbi:MAG: AAA family ATPase, partial [Epsilonproteobacteria bacterium]|nr:AAA family ATPase [Campylobacterota bacterium]